MQPPARRPHAAAAPLAAAVTLACSATVAVALPPGRAWTPVARIEAPGYGFTVAPRLEVDQAGVPELITLTVYPSDAIGFRWADSVWVEEWRLGWGSYVLWPVQSPPGTHHLVWNGVGPVANEWMFMAEVLPGGISEPETVTRVTSVRYGYSGAVSARRRWVAVSDIVANQWKLRVLSSDTAASWRDVPLARSYGSLGGVAMAPLGDTTALVAWIEDYALHWATLDGASWQEGQRFPDVLATQPQFRRRPSGGQWLAWGSGGPHVSLASYRDGVWSPPESLRCAYRDGVPFHSAATPDMSRDDGELPVIAWEAQDIRALVTICVCVPTDSGYGVAEELEGVAGIGGLPTVARDRNGDAWVAWSWLGGHAWWIHSYTRATCSRPAIAGNGRLRRVAWTLSEPAPETWWAILRARGSGPFEPVARVRAGHALEMGWTDSSPPAGVLRYRIRRESVDTRYLWESLETRWPERLWGPSVRLAVPNPVAREVRLEVGDAAAGPIEVLLYDLQGRVVLAERGSAGGTGYDTLRFDLGSALVPLPNGIYFAAVRDGSGRTSAPVKVVVLR